MNKFNRLLKVVSFGLICIIPAQFSYAGDVKAAIKEAVMKSGQAMNMPYSGAIVVFNEPDSIVITDNPRYVIKGRIFDMWQNVEIKNKAELEQSTRVIPLQKIKVNTTELLDVRANQEKSDELTIFLDPFEPSSAQTVALLTKYVKEFQLRFIFTSMSQANVDRMFDFACDIESKSSADVLSMIASDTVNPPKTQRKCTQTAVMNSFGLTHFLRLKTSPTLIAPNGTVSAKLPPNLMSWLAENKG